MYVQLYVYREYNNKRMEVNARDAQKQGCPFKGGLYIFQVCQARV